MAIPQSKIHICAGVPLDARYNHSIVFDTLEKQIEYFTSKTVKNFYNYTYLRRTWDMKVSCSFENAREWCYLYFQNTDDGKYWFYFINHVEYENDNMVKLSLELDVLQTYMFDYTLGKCFIERQHTTTDEVGQHTVDEGLETGELINRATQDVTELNDLCILVYSTFDPNHKDPNNTDNYLPWRSSYYGRVFSGMGIYAVAVSDSINFGGKLEEFSEAGAIDGVINMFMYPTKLVKLGSVSADQAQTWSDGIVCKYIVNGDTFTKDIGKQTKIGSYTPKNKKLLCYPYNLLYASNNAGAAAAFRYERFSGENCTFKFVGCYAPDGSVKMVPQNYNGVSDNYEEGFSLGTFPTCAWNSDMYKVWLAQNQNSTAVSAGVAAISVVGGAGAAIAGAFTANPVLIGGGVAAMGNGLNSVFSLMAAEKDQQVQPLQARGNHSVNVNVANGKQTFTFYKKTVTEERARMIDDYFTTYGYKLARVDTPNIKARPKFTYIKTVGCHLLDAKMNTEDRTKIETIFDNGLTFWRDANGVCNYSVDNSPA